MFRSIVALLGLAATGVGIWLITTEQPKNAACNASSHGGTGGLSGTGIGVGTSCLNIVWSYFGGFVLLAFGVLTVVIALAMMRKTRRNKNPRRAEPLLYPYKNPLDR
jgi:hydrogenase/urease accessory protein HupE